MTATAILLGTPHVIYYALGGLALGSFNALTLFLIRKQTPYEW